jgi:hypothetical protein
VLSPEEIRDPDMRALQQRYWNELKQITAIASAHAFPYHFYFSRKLDLAEKDQKENDQRSVQFDRYQGKVVLKITGNYFASYSADRMEREERSRETYRSVMLPLLQAAVQALGNADEPEAFAFEVSHHVRKKVLGVSSESVENVVLILPRASAERLTASADPRLQQAAVLEGEAFLNGTPISFWPRQEAESAQTTAVPAVSSFQVKSVNFSAASAKLTVEPVEKPSTTRDRSPEAIKSLSPEAVKDLSPEAIKELQRSFQSTLDRMVQELDSQAHFVRYAPPTLIPFHDGLYLQLSLTTTLSQAAAGSQYQLSALAFDRHIAHLIRPVLNYFRDRSDFDGIDFSTTVRFASAPDTEPSPVAVEFIFPRKVLNAYRNFDSTGQQLIDASFVLINGERVSLNLQAAEAGSSAQ